MVGGVVLRDGARNGGCSAPFPVDCRTDRWDICLQSLRSSQHLAVTVCVAGRSLVCLLSFLVAKRKGIQLQVL